MPPLTEEAIRNGNDPVEMDPWANKGPDWFPEELASACQVTVEPNGDLKLTLNLISEITVSKEILDDNVDRTNINNTAESIRTAFEERFKLDWWEVRRVILHKLKQALTPAVDA